MHPKNQEEKHWSSRYAISHLQCKRGCQSPVVQMVDHTAFLQDAVDTNHVWLIARPSNKEVCGWARYNILTRNDISVQEDSIGYLPIISDPATQLSTVNEVLHQLISIMKTLQLNNIVVVSDQILFAKAAEIT